MNALEAIRALHARIAALEAENARLREEIDRLRLMAHDDVRLPR